MNIILQSELNVARSGFDDVRAELTVVSLSGATLHERLENEKKESLKCYKATLATEQKWVNESYVEFL